MPLIDLIAAEYARLHPHRNKQADQFSDEIIALCSLLDQLLPVSSRAENPPS